MQRLLTARHWCSHSQRHAAQKAQVPVTLAYLMNTYPITSTTFVRREIHAHEAAGVPVLRYAIRNWSEDLVDPRDKAEIDKTTYILRQGAGRLAWWAVREAVSHPIAFARALRATLHLATRPKGAGVKSFAYLAEAVFFKQASLAAGVHHVHAHFSTNSAAVAMLSRLMGGPSYSFTSHGPDEFDDPAANALPLKLRHAAFVAAITSYAKGVISQATGGADDAKIAVVGCGIDLAEFAFTPVPDIARIVCVGRLCPAKAQALLVEAIAPLVANHPDLKLVLIGDGEDRAMIEARIAVLGLQDHVALRGWASGDEVRAEIGRARVFALPSYAEGLPIVLMESLALGRPVITTWITGIPELIDEKCGWLVTPGAVPEFTQALSEALQASSDVLQSMAAEGRARVTSRHNQKKNASALRALFPKPKGE